MSTCEDIFEVHVAHQEFCVCTGVHHSSYQSIRDVLKGKGFKLASSPLLHFNTVVTALVHMQWWSRNCLTQLPGWHLSPQKCKASWEARSDCLRRKFDAKQCLPTEERARILCTDGAVWYLKIIWSTFTKGWNSLYNSMMHSEEHLFTNWKKKKKGKEAFKVDLFFSFSCCIWLEPSSVQSFMWAASFWGINYIWSACGTSWIWFHQWEMKSSGRLPNVSKHPMW